MVAVRCRQIAEGDIAGVAALLARNFPRHSNLFWRKAFDRLGGREVPLGLPKYGYLLEADNAIVGTILMISSQMHEGGADVPRCNLSSWCVEPTFRSYASLLVSHALRNKQATYLNVSAAPQTWPTIEAQGFERYCDATFIAFPVLSGVRGEVGVKVVDARHGPVSGSDRRDGKMLLEHARCGCVSLWCVTEGGAYPFIFRPRLARRIIPGMQLIYCPGIPLFARFAGQIGRYLMLRGSLFVTIDAHEPIDGLIGRFRRSAMPKYFKGPQKPRLGDLAYTEVALLGI